MWDSVSCVCQGCLDADWTYISLYGGDVLARTQLFAAATAAAAETPGDGRFVGHRTSPEAGPQGVRPCWPALLTRIEGCSPSPRVSIAGPGRWYDRVADTAGRIDGRTARLVRAFVDYGGSVTTTGKTVARRPKRSAARREAAGMVAFTDNGPWHMTADDEATWQACHNTSLPSDRRIEMLATARANWWGHAAFGPDELCQRLGLARSTVTGALKNLKRRGMIAPESGERCVILNGGLVQILRADAKTPCGASDHYDRQRRYWIPRWGGWEPEDGLWDGYLSKDEGKDAAALYQDAIARAEAAMADARRLQGEAIMAAVTQQVNVNISGTVNGDVNINAAQIAEQVRGLAGVPVYMTPAEYKSARRQQVAEAPRPPVVVQAEVLPPAEPARCWRHDCNGLDTGRGQCWQHQQESDAARAEQRRAEMPVRERPKRLLGRRDDQSAA